MSEPAGSTPETDGRGTPHRVSALLRWLAAAVLLVLLILGVFAVGYWVAGAAPVQTLLFGVLSVLVAVFALKRLGPRGSQVKRARAASRSADFGPRTRPYPAIARAVRDRAEGRLWMARDRLGSLLSVAPADQEALDLLGQVHYDMGDLPNAGRHWFLTGRQGPEVDEALRALEMRYAFPEILRQVPARASTDSYPPAAQVRLRELEKRAKEAGIAWTPGRRGTASQSRPRDSLWDGFVDTVAVGFFIVVGPIVWLLGLVAAIGIIAELT